MTSLEKAQERWINHTRHRLTPEAKDSFRKGVRWGTYDWGKEEVIAVVSEDGEFVICFKSLINGTVFGFQPDEGFPYKPAFNKE